MGELIETLVRVKFKRNGHEALARPEIADRLRKKGEVEILKGGGQPADPVKVERPVAKKDKE